MGFWVYMFITALLVPLMMVAFGEVFRKKAPAKINAFFGYRTARSMKNADTWEFAHRYCGRLWLKAGTALAAVSAVAMLFVIGRDEDFVGTYGAALMGVQLCVMLVSIIPVERALKREFDDSGERRQ